MATEGDTFSTRFSDEEAEEQDSKEREACIQRLKSTDLIEFGSDWKTKFKETMKKLFDKEVTDDELEAVQTASLATCLVRRVNGSDGRTDYQKQTGKKQSARGTGTGLLIAPNFKGKGWLVITNNHVIMNKCEAKTAEVYFDYDTDAPEGTTKICNLPEVKMFPVSDLISTSLRTSSSDDTTTLDYSLLLLKPKTKDDDQFLESHACHFEVSARIQAANNKTIQRLVGRKCNPPIIMFSHPHGLAKRLCVGKFPSMTQICPVSHIIHDLTSRKGSSGGNILCCPVDRLSCTYWTAAFVHYRNGHAVSWQAIQNHLLTIDRE